MLQAFFMQRALSLVRLVARRTVPLPWTRRLQTTVITEPVPHVVGNRSVAPTERRSSRGVEAARLGLPRSPETPGWCAVYCVAV